MRYISAAVLLCGFNLCRAVDTVTIPLADMLTTSSQGGMRHVGEAFGANGKANKSTNGFLGQIYSTQQGSSNVFLVDAPDLNGAVNASASVFLGGRSASKLVPVDKPEAVRGNLWLVVFLGVGHSDPVKWVVESATIVDKKIQLTYREPEALIGTADTACYYYWISLGKLAHGPYEVELYDADEKAVTLMRRVVVEEAK